MSRDPAVSPCLVAMPPQPGLIFPETRLCSELGRGAKGANGFYPTASRPGAKLLGSLSVICSLFLISGARESNFT